MRRIHRRRGRRGEEHTTRRRPAVVHTEANGTDPEERRRREARELFEQVEGDPKRLEALRKHFITRLHLRSDDFEAADGLRVVELASRLKDRDAGPYDWIRAHAHRPPVDGS